MDRLKDMGKLDCLKLLHFHLASQIPNIRDDAYQSVQRSLPGLYGSGLKAEGAAMVEYFDLGGGLAVDYDGSQTNYISQPQLRPGRILPTISWMFGQDRRFDEEDSAPSGDHLRVGSGHW